MTLQLLHSEFPYIWGNFYFLFYQRILYSQHIPWWVLTWGYRDILYTNILYTLQSLYVTKFIQTFFIHNKIYTGQSLYSNKIYTNINYTVTKFICYKIYTNIICTETKLIHDYHWVFFLLPFSFIHLKSLKIVSTCKWIFTMFTPASVSSTSLRIHIHLYKCTWIPNM